MVDKISDVITIILAGGLGTRLGEITRVVPKPMVRINGVPFLYYQIEYLRKRGLKKFIICVSYLSEQIIEYFGNGSKFDVSIEYSVEQEALGTGGAIVLANKLFPISEIFFVINGDTFIDFNPNLFYSFYMKNKFLDLIMGLSKSSKNDTSIIKISDKNKIISYLEKPDKIDRDSYSGAGVYLLKKKLINYFGEGNISLENDVIPDLLKSFNLYSEFVNSFYDIGTKERLKKFKDFIEVIN